MTDVLQAHLTGEHMPLGRRCPALRPAVADLVEEGLSPESGRRSPSAAAMARRLEAAAAGRGQGSAATVALPLPPPRAAPVRGSGPPRGAITLRPGTGRRRLPVVAGALLVLALLLLLLRSVLSSPGAPGVAAGSFDVVTGSPLPAGSVELRWTATGPGRAIYEVWRDGVRLSRRSDDGAPGPRRISIRGLEGGASYAIRLADGQAWLRREVHVPSATWARPLLALSLWGRVFLDCRVENVENLRVRLETEGGETVERKLGAADFPVVLPEKRRLAGTQGERIRWSVHHGKTRMAAGELPLERPVHLAWRIEDARFAARRTDRCPRRLPVLVGRRSVVAARWGVVLAYEARRHSGAGSSACPLRLAFAYPLLQNWTKGDGGGRIEGLTALPGGRIFFSKEGAAEAPLLHVLSVPERTRRWKAWELEPPPSSADRKEWRQRSVLRRELFDPRGPWWTKLSPGESRWAADDLQGLFPRARGHLTEDGALLLPVEDRHGGRFGMLCYDVEKRRRRWCTLLPRTAIEGVPCIGWEGKTNHETVLDDDRDERWSSLGTPLPVGNWVYQQLRIDRTRRRTSHDGALLAFPAGGDGPGRVLFRHLRNDEQSSLAVAPDGKGVWLVAPFGILRADADRSEAVELLPVAAVEPREGAFLHGAHARPGRDFALSAWRGVGTGIERNFGNSVLGGRFAMRLLSLRLGGEGLLLSAWPEDLALDFGLRRMALRNLDSRDALLWGTTPHKLFVVNRRTGACGVVDGADVSSSVAGAVRTREGEIHLFDSDGRAFLMSMELLLAASADQPDQLLRSAHRLSTPRTRPVAFRSLRGAAPRCSPR